MTADAAKLETQLSEHLELINRYEVLKMIDKQNP